MTLARRALAALALASPLAWAGCGARSGLSDCYSDADCAARDLCATQRCVARACVVIARTVCDDADPCTNDACDKKTGACVFAPLTFDLDKDGHRAPLAGKAPGAPGACGDDCDDSDARAYPGGREVCDGVDNDCDGVIDNGAVYAPRSPGSDVRVSTTDLDYAESGALVRGGGDVSLATYLGFTNQQLQPYTVMLDDLGAAKTTPKTIGTTPAAAGSAIGAWTGDRYGVAWSDRRDGNYEIYFATFDANGAKLAPGDIRVTVTDGFSIYPALAWTGAEFALVWQEELEPHGWRLDGQRLGLDGRLLGDIVKVVDLTNEEQAPALAFGQTELGLAWVRLEANVEQVYFATLGLDLALRSKPARATEASGGGRAATVVWAKDRFLTAWYAPKPGARAVMTAPFGADGARLSAPRKVADTGASETRDPALLSLGDRVLAVYADDRDGNGGYELYARMLDTNGGPLGLAQRVTNAPGDSISPSIAFGHTGSVGVLFRDDRGARPAVYFTSLACAQ